VFLRAVQSYDHDGYSHHGRARSLDLLGHDADEVERGYERALALEPLQPAWHAHRVSLLADLGRLDETRRAWAEAESAVLDGGERIEVYDALHAPVAATLIALGELQFAAYVLDGVPSWARDAEHRRLRTLLSGRLAAEKDGAFVPAPRSATEWWREAPQVLPQRDTDGRQLVRWAAGRPARCASVDSWRSVATCPTRTTRGPLSGSCPLLLCRRDVTGPWIRADG
jgi:hypothetical protein